MAHKEDGFPFESLKVSSVCHLGEFHGMVAVHQVHQLLSNQLIVRLTQCEMVSQHRDELLYGVIDVGTNNLLYRSFLQQS